jgi:protein-S-isoprenylcysteine O-methyltransferase Ste14
MVLFWRAATAFLLLPGIVAFVVPWLLLPAQRQFHFAGAPLLAIGSALLVWCVRDFCVAGRGTLAPWAPPEHLVTVGLYRLSRNPMYVAVLLILAGWAAAFPTPPLWIYAAFVALSFHLRVVYGEEPWLAQRHGPAWQAYRTRVPRWLGPVTVERARSDRDPGY